MVSIRDLIGPDGQAHVKQCTRRGAHGFQRVEEVLEQLQMRSHDAVVLLDRIGHPPVGNQMERCPAILGELVVIFAVAHF